MKKTRQLNFLMTGTGSDGADQNPFLVALANDLPGVSVFQKKKAMGTLDGNYASVRRQLGAAVKANNTSRVVLVGHSEGGVHAMRLAKLPYVDLAVVCATAIGTFREIMLYQHECRPPVPCTIRAMLNSKPWSHPAETPGTRDRKAIRDWLTAVGWPTTDEFVNYNTSLLRYNGAELIRDAPGHKLVFVYAKHDMNVPMDLSVSNIQRVDTSIRVKQISAYDHNFRTKKRKQISRTALRQIVAVIRPNN